MIGHWITVGMLVTAGFAYAQLAETQLTALNVGLSYNDPGRVNLTGLTDGITNPVSVTVLSETGKEITNLLKSSTVINKDGKDGVGVDYALAIGAESGSSWTKKCWTMTFVVPLPEGSSLTFDAIQPQVFVMTAAGKQQANDPRTLKCDVSVSGGGLTSATKATVVTQPLMYDRRNSRYAFFDSPITVTDSFTVSVTVCRDNAQTQTYAGLAGLAFAADVPKVDYVQQTVTFSERAASEPTIVLNQGWALRSLEIKESDGAPLTGEPWLPKADPSYFAPNVNIETGGSWEAVFQAPENFFTDRLSLPFAILNASGVVQQSLRGMNLEVYADLDTTPLFSGCCNGKGEARIEASFSPRKIQTLKVICKQHRSYTNGAFFALKSFDCYRYDGVTELYAGQLGAPKTVAFSQRQATNPFIELNNGWKLNSLKLDEKEPTGNPWLTTTNGNPVTYFAPNTNVGFGGAWEAEFTAPRGGVKAKELSLPFAILNSSANVQRIGRGMTLTVYVNGEATPLFTTEGESATGSLELKGTFTQTTIKTLKIKCSQHSTNREGAFFALKSFTVDGFSAEMTSLLLVNPTSWPSADVGAVVLTAAYKAFPKAPSKTQYPLYARVLKTPETLLRPTIVMSDGMTENKSNQELLRADTYFGGGVEPINPELRPGTPGWGAFTPVYKEAPQGVGFRLKIGPRVTFDTEGYVLYAGPDATVDDDGKQWWHSASAGEPAKQGVLPAETVGEIWLEGGRVTLANGTTAIHFHEKTIGGTVEIVEGRTAVFAATTGSGESNPTLPAGVSLELGGSLSMDGTLPSLKVISKTAALSTETGLTVNDLVATDGAALAIVGGTVSLQKAPLPLVLNGGSLAVTSEPQVTVTMPSLTVVQAGDLQVAAGSLTLTDLAVNADLTLAGNPLTVTNPVTGTGRLLLPKDTEVTEQGTAVLTGSLADGATVSVAVDGRKDLWFVVEDGTVVLRKIGGSKPSKSGNTVLDAAYEKLYADAVAAGLPAGTKQLVYVQKRTMEGAAPEGNADIAVLAASLFGLTPTVADAADEKGQTTVTVAYDFGISALTVGAASEGHLKVVVDISVQKPGKEGPVPADYAANCGLRLRLTNGSEIANVAEVIEPSLPKGTRRFTAILPADVTLFKAEAFAKE